MAINDNITVMAGKTTTSAPDVETKSTILLPGPTLPLLVWISPFTIVSFEPYIVSV